MKDRIGMRREETGLEQLFDFFDKALQVQNNRYGVKSKDKPEYTVYMSSVDGGSVPEYYVDFAKEGTECKVFIVLPGVQKENIRVTKKGEKLEVTASVNKVTKTLLDGSSVDLLGGVYGLTIHPNKRKVDNIDDVISSFKDNILELKINSRKKEDETKLIPIN